MSKAVKRKRAKAAKAGKFNIERLDRTYTNAEGKVVNLPALVDAVYEIFTYNTRGQIIQQLRPLYGCSEQTIDRAISKCKVMADEYARAPRQERLRRAVASLEAIKRKAIKVGNFQAARGAMVDQARIYGDLKVKIEVDQSRKPAEELTDEQLLAIITAPDKQARGKRAASAKD
jgi:hypothetical protein